MHTKIKEPELKCRCLNGLHKHCTCVGPEEACSNCPPRKNASNQSGGTYENIQYNGSITYSRVNLSMSADYSQRFPNIYIAGQRSGWQIDGKPFNGYLTISIEEGRKLALDLLNQCSKAEAINEVNKY